MHEGGYGIFVPAMLVYRENTTSGIRKITIPIFIYEGLPREIHANEERSEFHRGGYGAFAPAMLVYRENTTPITIKDSSRYEALPRNVIFVALPLNGGRASRIPFPGRAWERGEI